MQGRKNIFLLLLYETIAFISVVLCFTVVNQESKSMMFIMPLSFFLFFLLSHSNFVENRISIPFIMIETLFFIRLVILPLLYAFISSEQLFEGRESIATNFNSACLLLAYEYFLVQVAFWFYTHKHQWAYRDDNENLSGEISDRKLILMLVSFLIIVTVLFPNCRSSFKTIFELSDPDFTVGSGRTQYNIGFFSRVIKTLYSMCFQIFRIIFPVYCIYDLYKKNHNSRKLKVVLLISCVLQFFFLTATFAEAIISCLTILLFYLSLYPEHKKQVYFILGLTTVGMLVLYFTIRLFVSPENGLYNKDSGFWKYMAQIINAYFTGVDNVSAILNIPHGNEVEAFTAGILGAIPFNSTLFGDRGNKLQYFFNISNRSYGQIPPTLGAGYYYFGRLLSPIITVVFVLFSMFFYEKACKSKDSLKYVAYILCSIVFALGTVMYSSSITMALLLGWSFPILLITLIISKDYINQKG